MAPPARLGPARRAPGGATPARPLAHADPSSPRSAAYGSTFNGPINGESFTGWVEHALVPTLSPGDVVVMDNLGSHKGRAVRAAIRSAGAHLLFLPLYSPDLNPIEQVFAKLRHVLREAASRSLDAVTASIAAILDRFTPQECADCLTNAGYASS